MEDTSKSKTFNAITAGYGGQGVLTLAKILARAAFIAGLDVRQAELHGLSQRGGSLVCHVRFGEEVYSPLIRKGEADLVIALEAVEALRVCEFANPEKTVVLTNAKLFSPAQLGGVDREGSNPQRGARREGGTLRKSEWDTGDLGLGKIIAGVEKFATSVETIDADQIVRELTGENTSVNIFMLAWALGNGHLPLEKDIVWQAVTKTLRPQFLDSNRRVFDTALKS